DRLLGPDQAMFATWPGHHCPHAFAFVSQQVHSESLIPDRNVGGFMSPLNDGTHDLVPGGIAEGMHDTAMAVSSLAPQSETAIFDVEIGPPLNQGIDLPGRLANH